MCQCRKEHDRKRWGSFCNAVKNGEAKNVQTILNEFMNDSISIRDTCVRKDMKENFYHGMLLGLLKAQGNWIVKSNSESGIGYVDIQIIIPSEKTGCIIEVKYAEKGSYDTACNEAMKQIDKTGYTEILKKEEVQTIYKYGIACYKKRCKVVCEQEK